MAPLAYVHLPTIPIEDAFTLSCASTQFSLVKAILILYQLEFICRGNRSEERKREEFFLSERKENGNNLQGAYLARFACIVARVVSMLLLSLYVILKINNKLF
jgi:hypothetical protein